MDTNTTFSTPINSPEAVKCPEMVRPVKFKEAFTGSVDARSVAQKLEFTEGMSAATLVGP